MISFQQKGLEKGLTGMDNVAGGLIGIMGGGKPDVKNVMNVVSVGILSHLNHSKQIRVVASYAKCIINCGLVFNAKQHSHSSSRE